MAPRASPSPSASTRDRALDQKAYTVGGLACIPKPVRREALLAVVQTTLAQHPAAHGTAA